MFVYIEKCSIFCETAILKKKLFLYFLGNFESQEEIVNSKFPSENVFVYI